MEAVAAKPSKQQLAGQGGVKVWGVYLNDEGCFQPPPESLNELIALTRSVMRKRLLRTSLLQRLVGKWLWYYLMVRPCLSVFGPLFRQCRSQSRWIKLWPSGQQVFRELIAMAPLLQVNPSRPLGRLVATDSSGYGGGVAVAREYSMETFEQLSRFCYYKGRGDLVTPAYHEELGALLEPMEFPAFAWKWKDKSEHITVKEARALFTGFKRAAFHSGSPVGSHHFFLVDNQGVVGSFTRGRSSNPVINSLIQRTAALELITGMTHDIAWVPTRFQPADRASRQ